MKRVPCFDRHGNHAGERYVADERVAYFQEFSNHDVWGLTDGTTLEDDGNCDVKWGYTPEELEEELKNA